MKILSKTELIEILQNLIRFKTENPPGKTHEIIDFLISKVFKEKLGFENQIVEFKKKNVELRNLVTKIGNGKRKIVLCGHFDVVPAGDISQWTYQPFSAEIVDDKVYGRGSADMKGGLAMIIGVLFHFLEEEDLLRKFTMYFLGTADEESGMSGSAILSRRGIVKDADFLIIAEPTKLNIGIAEKGVLWVDLIVRGKSAHGSMPYEGINSVYYTGKIINQLDQTLDNLSNEVLGTSTLNIGKIVGGTVRNIVPEQTILSLDYRLIPEQDFKRIVENLKQLDVAPCTLKTKIISMMPALQTDRNHPLIKNLQSLSHCEIMGFPYGTDAITLVKPRKPVPFMIYGPGDPKIVHQPNEHIELKQIFNGIERLTKAISMTFK